MKMPSESSQTYLQDKKIPELFQSLTIALLYHRPENHVDYLLDCLDKVKAQGSEKVAWDSFLPANNKTEARVMQGSNPLPSLNATLIPGTRN